jgi:hypothetical protein
MKKLLNTFKKFQLTTPVSIIIGSLIFSFHYVWINKHDFQVIKHNYEGLEFDVITVTNKWTGYYCSFIPNSLQYSHRINLDKDSDISSCYENHTSDDYGIKLP